MKLPEGLRHWPEYKYLFTWLKVATKGLSDESRARVREEIADHFHEAIVEGMRAGLTEDRAGEQAVASLGSPKAARRAFRRTYLTRYQAKIVHDLVEPTKRILFLYAYMVSAATVITVAFPRRGEPEWLIRSGMLALMAAAAIIVVSTAPGLYRRGRQRAAVVLGAVATTVIWMLWMAFVGGDLGKHPWVQLAVLLFMAVNYVPALLKIGKHPEAT